VKYASRDGMLNWLATDALVVAPAAAYNAGGARGLQLASQARRQGLQAENI
jgi:hypothetical protein